jgi:hypothetical protein
MRSGFNALIHLSSVTTGFTFARIWKVPNGSGRRRYHADALAAGCNGLEKPFDIGRLRTYVVRDSNSSSRAK